MPGHHRGQERHRVDGDGDRGGHELHQCAGNARARDLRHRATHLQLAVALDQVVAVDQRRQVRLVGDVEEHREDAGQQAHQVELLDAQRAEQGGDRNRAEQERAAEVGEDQDGSAPQTVDPDAGEQAEQQERREFEGAQQPHLARRRVEHQRRRQRNGQQTDLAAKARNRLPSPQLHKLGMSPQPRKRDAPTRGQKRRTLEI